jgi:membrane protein implicated in regulation of membrane protease activity
MTWEIFYLACFLFGLALCLVSVVTGGHTHGSHFHFGGHSHVHIPRGTPRAAHSSAEPSSVNGFTVTAFLCWFGGVGYLLGTHSGLLPSLVLLLSTLSGLAGGALIFWFLASVLMPREHSLTAEETEITGVVGRVTGPLRPNGTGEIVYTQLGARKSVPARAENGATIERGSEVVVLRYERGVAYVRPWQDLEP